MTPITQSEIDHNSKRTDKRYFIIETQLRSAVKPDAYMERFSNSPRYSLLQKQLGVLLVVVVTGVLLAAHMGWIDWPWR